MIKVVVSSPELVERKGVTKQTYSPAGLPVPGKDYHLRIQTAHAFCIDPHTGAAPDFPDKFEILLDKDQVPYGKGVYQLSPAAIFVGRDGRIDVRPLLIPIPTGKPS
jgi:hypothetical protein